MSVRSARKWLILASLSITGLQMLFLIMAPSFGFPLVSPENFHLLEIVSPVFLGYLGSASHFVFNNPVPEVPVQNEFLAPLVIGPIVIYLIVVAGAVVVFAYSNRLSAPAGTGMSEGDLATALSSALGLLAVTTGVVTSYLFVSADSQVAPHPVGEAIKGTGET